MVRDDPARQSRSLNSLDFPRPLTTVDVAIFTVQGDRLQVLLVRRGAETGEPFPNAWVLPGGFVDVTSDKDLEGCALRKLREKTGVASTIWSSSAAGAAPAAIRAAGRPPTLASP